MDHEILMSAPSDDDDEKKRKLDEKGTTTTAAAAAATTTTDAHLEQEENTGNGVDGVAVDQPNEDHASKTNATKKRRRSPHTQNSATTPKHLTNACKKEGIPSWFQLQPVFATANSNANANANANHSVDDYLVQHNVIPLLTHCPRRLCGKPLPPLSFSLSTKKGHRQRCRKCESIYGTEWSQTIYKATFLDGSFTRIDRSELLLFLYHWCLESKHKQLALITGWSNPSVTTYTRLVEELVATSLVGDATTIDTTNAQGQQQQQQQQQQPIGGPNIHVQLGDCKFGRRRFMGHSTINPNTNESTTMDSIDQDEKNSHQPPTRRQSSKPPNNTTLECTTTTTTTTTTTAAAQEDERYANSLIEGGIGNDNSWILCGVELSNTRHYFVTVVPDRTPETLAAILQHYIAAGSILRVDWPDRPTHPDRIWTAKDIVDLQKGFDYQLLKAEESTAATAATTTTGIHPPEQQPPSVVMDNQWNNIFWDDTATTTMTTPVPHHVTTTNRTTVHHHHHHHHILPNNSKNPKDTASASSLPPGWTAVKRTEQSTIRKYPNVHEVVMDLLEFTWRKKNKGDIWNAMLRALQQVRYDFRDLSSVKKNNSNNNRKKKQSSK